MAETITIQGSSAHLKNGKGEQTEIAVDKLARGIVDQTLHGLDAVPLPDNIKWQVCCGSLTICIVQLTPELRWVKWLADDSPVPYGPEAICTERRLATPYVILKVPFLGQQIIPKVEVFYRNQPLSSLEGDGGMLYWPNLLNVSPNAYGCTAWFCTQYLSAEKPRPGIHAGLDAVVHHLFGGLFNASSEAHEGASTFSKCVKEKVDPRITDVNRWEEESQKDPKFAMSVAWKSTGVTVGKLIENELKRNKIQTAPGTAAALGNILLRQAKAK